MYDEYSKGFYVYAKPGNCDPNKVKDRNFLNIMKQLLPCLLQ